MGESKALCALFPGSRRLILTAIFADPERWWSLADLAGRAGMGAASLRRQLAPLRDGGVIREKLEDGRVFIQPDTDCPVFPDLQAILSKLAPTDHRRETVLVVEDQPATAQITRILLESWGYQVLEAHDAPEALSIFDVHSGEVSLLLTDIIMPGMDGIQLADELQGRDAALRVILMSGEANHDGSRPNAAFLPKPFNPASLARAIRRELDRPEAAPKSRTA